MLGKFGGIVIFTLTGAIVAGLILRPAPENLSPAMDLGVPTSTPNTLETTDDNQDKIPAKIEAVNEAIKLDKKPVEAMERETPKEPFKNDDSTSPDSTNEAHTEKTSTEADKTSE